MARVAATKATPSSEAFSAARARAVAVATQATWSSVATSEADARAEFEALLTRLIRENYLKRIRTDKKYDLAYVGEEQKPRGTHVITNVSLSRDGKPEVVEVVYVMHQVGGTWKTEDIITDGVSLAKNYKFEFNKILKDKGINELIARLEAKLTELAANSAAKK